MEEGARSFEFGPCLGRGGFGEVYRATLHNVGGLSTEVAVKLLHPDVDARSQALQRLRDEGRLLARLRHPHILRVVDLVVLEGRAGLVTEYVEGADLSACVAQGMPLRGTIEAIAAVASALDAAHAAPQADGTPARIVHRDVKPSNVRVSRHGEVKLLDFGIARTEVLQREARTESRMLVGSPGYVAPERFLGDESNPASDVFSLGATLYECVAGAVLYEGTTMMLQSTQALDAEMHDDFIDARLAMTPPSVPAPVIAVLRETLRHDPAARPTAAALARRLRDLADGLPGPGVVRWAESHAWPAPSSAEGPFAGRTLTETRPGATRPADRPSASTLSSLPAAPPRPEPAPARPPAPLLRRWLAFGAAGLVLLGGGGLLALVSGGAGLWALLAAWDRDGSAAPVDAPEAPAPLPDEPAPPVEVAVAPEPSPPEPAPDAPRRERAPTASAPAAAPSSHAAPDDPPAPAGAAVHAPDRVRVRLHQGDRVLPAGRVPAGAYDLTADFGRGYVSVGHVEVRDGDEVHLSCSPALETCTPMD